MKERDLASTAFLMAAGVVIAPVAAVVGAVVGVAKGNYAEDIAATSSAIREALVAARPTEAIRAGMVERAEAVGRELVNCPDADSPGACRAAAWAPIATLVRVRAGPPVCEVEGKINPSFRLLLRAEASVLRGGSVKPVYVRGWVCRGPLTDCFDLAHIGAAEFRAQLAAAERAIAAKATADLLQGGNPEVHPTPEQPEGSVWTVLPPGVPQAALDRCEAARIAGLPVIP
jgi:hypothetical protein